MSGRAVLLVDGGYYSNIDYFCRDTAGGKLDLVALSNRLCDEFDCDLLRTKFYHAYPYRSDSPTQDEQERYRKTQSFFDAIDNLRECQFVEKGRVKQEHADCPECDEHFTHPSQKGVDVGIAVDLVEMAYQGSADAFILLSGDEDLKHAVSAAKERLANVYLAFAANSDHGLYVSSQLSQEVDGAFRMQPEFLGECVQ